MRKKLLLLSAGLLIAQISLKAQGQGTGGSLNANTQWKTNGNTALSADFMGTTNQQSLKLKSNNVQALEIKPTGDINFSHLTSGNGDGILLLKGGGDGYRLDFTHDFSHVLNGQGLFTNISAITGLKVSGNNIIQTLSGNIGIGTTTPSEKISVVGGGSFTGALSADALTVTSLAGTGNRQIFVDANGRLQKGGPEIVLNACFPANPSWAVGGNNFSSATFTDQRIGTCDPSDFILMAGSNSAMYIKPSGLIGIGKSTPSAILDVNTSGTTTGFNLSNGTTNLFNVAGDGSTLINSIAPVTNAVPSFAVQNATGTPFEVKANGHVVVNDDPSSAFLGLPSFAHFQINVTGNTLPFLISSKKTTGGPISLFGVEPDGSTVINDGDPLSSNPILTMTHINPSGFISTLKFMQDGVGDIFSSNGIRPTCEYGFDFTVLEGHPGTEQLRLMIPSGGGALIQTNHATPGGDALVIYSSGTPVGTSATPAGTGTLIFGGPRVFTVLDDGSTIISSSSAASPFTVNKASTSAPAPNTWSNTLFEVTASGQTYI